ncbi:MAG: hypothetical protein JNM36_14450 [Chitinophagales bacterium]|nr:hypothetical protein [Chitinophagales bacterium]
MNFKILFMAPYDINLTDVLNDNLDINVVLENGDVFFGFFVTLNNIDYLMKKDDHFLFYSEDMVIVRSVDKETIKAAVTKIVERGHLDSAFSYIGKISETTANEITFEDIVDLGDFVDLCK